MANDPEGHALAQRTGAVAALAREAADSEDRATLERLEMELGSLRSLARERMQARYRDAYEELAAKLEGSEPLSDGDRRLLAVIATGAASVYLRNENDLDAWRKEIRRLAEVLERTPEPDGGSGSEFLRYLHVQATVEEAMRVVPDVRFFLEEGERLRRFQSASREIDPDERRFLARLIRDQLASDRR